jgi:hypothetical protein
MLMEWSVDDYFMNRCLCCQNGAFRRGVARLDGKGTWAVGTDMVDGLDASDLRTGMCSKSKVLAIHVTNCTTMEGVSACSVCLAPVSTGP